jgi:hypothetical protein
MWSYIFKYNFTLRYDDFYVYISDEKQTISLWEASDRTMSGVLSQETGFVECSANKTDVERDSSGDFCE